MWFLDVQTSKESNIVRCCFKIILEEMVGVTGIEPVTPSMSTKCSPAELHPHTISYGQPSNQHNNHVDAGIVPTGGPFAR